MVFDLITRLEAKKRKPKSMPYWIFRRERASWKDHSELEYSITDVYAVEFELSLENASVKEYKVSFQGTLGTFDEERMLHGWASHRRRKNEEKAYAAEALYVNGYRFSSKRSTMNMFGIFGRGSTFVPRRSNDRGLEIGQPFFNHGRYGPW
jgi:hypothetical protein